MMVTAAIAEEARPKNAVATENFIVDKFITSECTVLKKYVIFPSVC